MTTRKLLELAARLFAEQGGDAEVYVPIVLTSQQVLHDSFVDDEADQRHARPHLEARFRRWSADTPDRVHCLEAWLMSEAGDVIPSSGR